MDTLGWREWVTFPGLPLPAIKAKVDTGARTSSLHVMHHHRFRRADQEWMRFHVPLDRRPHRPERIVACEAEYLEHRDVRDSGGRQTRRPVVRLTIGLADRAWPVEVTLADRSQNGFRMLLGREAVRGRFVVDPTRSFCATPDAWRPMEAGTASTMAPDAVGAPLLDRGEGRRAPAHSSSSSG